MSMARESSSDTMPIRRIVAISAPNLVPLSGIFFFGWSAPNLLILYSLDTILSIGAMGALGAAPTAPRGRLGWVSGIVFMFVIALVLAIPFGGWTFLLLAPFGWSVTAALADHAFVRGVLIQMALALAAFVHGYRVLAGRGDADPLLRRRMVFILARYTITLLAGIAGLEIFGVLPHELGGQLQGFLLVGVYLGSSTFFELSPGAISVLDRETSRSNKHAPAASHGSVDRYEAASADPAASPGVLIVGFLIGVLLVGWNGRRLWNAVRGSSPVVSGWIIPVGLLVAGLWFLYRAIRLARRRRQSGKGNHLP